MSDQLNRIEGGCLIAFEGIDGSGKSTIARQIVGKLCDNGYLAELLREPTDGPHGLELRRLMVSPGERNPQREFELFLLDRRDDVKLNIRPLMSRGSVVCIDRYYISSMAYQGALGIDPDLIREENEKFAPVPDLILRFKVDVETALGRIAGARPAGPNQFEKRPYLESVDRIFTQMNFSQMLDIDANQPLEHVFNETWTIVKNVLK